MSARKRSRFIIWCDVAGKWRWTYRAKNGRIQATGAESYTRRSDCWKALQSLISAAGEAEVEFLPSLGRSRRLAK